jgi:outer membrane protein OmpA-like peptidoglycan-associated protein
MNETGKWMNFAGMACTTCNTMRKIFVLLLMRFFFVPCLLLFAFPCLSQSLLLNGDFEEENICTEYKVNCAPEAWLTNDDVFNNYYKDSYQAYQGSHCMSIIAGQAGKTSKRTFIRSRLLCGLRKGNEYRLEFFIKSAYPVLDSIGIYFSASDLLFDRRPLQAFKPSVYLGDINNLQFKKDDSWQHITCNYTAKGDESFIVIGNFSKKEIKGETGLPMENRFFVYVDLVSLVPLNPKENLCEEWQANMEEIYDEDERHDFLKKKIIYGRNRSPQPVVLQSNTISRVDTLVLQELLFESGKSNLFQDSYRLLDSFCKVTIGRKVDSVVVEGHTDNRGSDEMNNLLSSARVQTVLNYFASRTFVKPNRVFARAWGESRPVANNKTPQGRQRNRRVVVFLYLRE